MKGKTNIYTSQLGVEKLHLTLVTNQSEHSDIINTNVTVNDKVYTYKGTELVIDILPGQNYSIIFEDVEGYKTPETITYTSKSNNNRFITATYETEILAIDLSENTGLIGAIITIDNQEYIWDGNVIKRKIPFGKSYTVSFSDLKGYTKPAGFTRTASLPGWYPNVKYTKQLGVFIMDNEGDLYNLNETGYIAPITGVALITDKCDIVIAPDYWYSEDGYMVGNPNYVTENNIESVWGGAGKIVTDIKTTTSESDMITDFDGSRNTDKIITQLLGTQDSHGYIGAPAAEYCRAYSSGCKGEGQWYLPSAGEINQIVLNYDTVKTALDKVNAPDFNSSSHQCMTSSTQYDDDEAWAYNWYSKFFYESTKYTYNDVRPICQINNQSGQVIWFKIGVKLYTGIYNQTVQEWVNSSHNVDNMYIKNNKLYTSFKAEVKNVTASTVLVSGTSYEAGGASVIVNLNSQWANSTKSSISGYKCFQSNKSYNVNSGVDIMTITINGFTEFTCYIRSYAESYYDFVMIGQLDQAITGGSSYSNTTLVKAHTHGNQQSGTALSNYTAVTYSGIDGGEHTITVVYRKDSGVNKNDDRGYLLIPDENLTINA